MTPQLDAVRDYLNRGISVLPLQAGHKQPIGSWRRWQGRHMPMETAKLWWSGTITPAPGVGVITGPISQDLAVLDIEPEHVKFATDAIPLPDTARATTARGGLHLYCRGRARCGKLKFEGRVIGDVRGRGGYVVAPPSELAAGKYMWHTPADFSVDALAELPKWAAPRDQKPQPPVLSSRSDTSASILGTKVQMALTAPQVFRHNRSASEFDYWIVRNCIWVGMSFEDIEALFMLHPVGANALAHEARGGTDYLLRTYEAALLSVQNELESAVWVRCLRTMTVSGLSCTRSGPIARTRASIEVSETRRPRLYRQAIPHILADGTLSGEWLQFLRAFGIKDPTEDPVLPRKRGRAIVADSRIIRFIDPEVWPCN